MARSAERAEVRQTNKQTNKNDTHHEQKKSIIFNLTSISAAI